MLLVGSEEGRLTKLLPLRMHRRVGRVGEDPRENVGVGVDVGVVECGLYRYSAMGDQRCRADRRQ